MYNFECSTKCWRNIPSAPLPINTLLLFRTAITFLSEQIYKSIHYNFFLLLFLKICFFVFLICLVWVGFLWTVWFEVSSLLFVCCSCMQHQFVSLYTKLSITTFFLFFFKIWMFFCILDLFDLGWISYFLFVAVVASIGVFIRGGFIFLRPASPLRSIGLVFHFLAWFDLVDCHE